MQAYELNRELYQKAAKHQKEWGNHLLLELHLNGHESILDLGCGDGGLTQQLSLLVPEGKVLEIDASSGMVETSKKHVGNHLEYILMNITSLSYHNEFNVIFLNAVKNITDR